MKREKISHRVNVSEKLKRMVVFLVTKALKDITNFSLKLAQVVSINVLLYSNDSQYFGTIKINR